MAIMAVSQSCEEAEFTRPTSSRDSHRHSCARAHGRRSAAHQEAIVEERKQRSRSKTRKQRIRSKTRNSDRRDKWEELYSSEVPEEVPSSPPPPIVDSMVEVARFSAGDPKSFQDAMHVDLRLQDLYQHYMQQEYEQGSQQQLWNQEYWREMEEKRRGRDGGWFLVVDPATRMAALQRYQSRDGCESCDYYLISSDDGVSEAVESALELLAVPCREMYRRAKLCVDPKFEFRRMRKADLGYDAVMALYASYLHFHEQTFPTPRPRRQPCPAWKCRMWTGRAVRAVVKVQALWRGWYFRQRVLFNPHTEIGRRFLERQWQRLQDPSVETLEGNVSLFTYYYWKRNETAPCSESL